MSSSSKPLFSLATYFARRHSEISGPYLGEMPVRPEGTVIWVWATNPDQVITLQGLAAQLAADGDQISFVISLPNVPADFAGQVMTAPVNRSQTQTFLTHWSPSLVLWMRDSLEPSALIEISDRDIPCILLEATIDALRPEHGAWVPGLSRAMLQQFTKILTVDASVSTTLLKAGADPNVVEPLGVMETAPPALSHFEDERQEMAKVLGSRPVWLAADTSPAEVDMLADAHHHASLRSHRLLLIVSLQNEDDGPDVADRLRDRGFLVALRSADETPDAATQIYVADFEGEMGLWYRISPITYLGNSFSDGPRRNPFEAATLGSAVIHGPNIAPYQGQIKRLAEADACVSVRNKNELGGEIERLLAPDVAALLVHGAWEVTSRGAEITGRIAEVIIDRLDNVGG